MHRLIACIATTVVLAGCATPPPPASHAAPQLRLAPALLGNAGEFLDPVFSSGVTIAFKSASLATQCLAREFAGETVDWQADYAVPLKAGVDTFRTFVDAWYAGGFQKIIFHERHTPDIRRMISSILAGYAWDQNNPYVSQAKRRLGVLEELCSA